MSPLTALLIVVGAIVVIAIFLIIIGLTRPQSQVTDKMIAARLEELASSNEQVTLEKLEMSLPFTERVIFPVARRLGEFATRFTPQNALNDIQRKLELAGTPARMDPTLILAMQFFCAALFGGLILLVFTVGSWKMAFGAVVLIAAVSGLVGFFFPQLWLGSKIARRQKSIRRSMPDALDLLTICVEAGLGFDAAMSKVAEKWDTDLSLAFTRVIQEIQYGKLRRDALRDMAERIGLPEMTSFTAAVIQSEQLGVSLAKVLRIQSDQMRIKRRQLAEEEAHKAPIKMLIPLALLIFPSLMIVLLTPAALRLMQSALGAMFR
jgi:tight adherence protein C